MNCRETTFRSLMADFRSRQSLDAEAIQSFADQFSRLWQERRNVYNVRLARARNMLLDAMDNTDDAPLTTGVSASLQNADTLTTGVSASLQNTETLTTGVSGSPSNRKVKEENEEKDEKEEPFPHTPYKKKEQEEKLEKKASLYARNARACEESDAIKSATATRAVFAKPTLEDVAAYIKEKGYTFSAETFWSFYESKGWKVGRVPMKSWKAACVTWQVRTASDAKAAAQRQAHIDAKMAEREAARQAHIDAKIEERGESRRGGYDHGGYDDDLGCTCDDYFLRYVKEMDAQKRRNGHV